jgi:hypothetical protein
LKRELTDESVPGRHAELIGLPAFREIFVRLADYGVCGKQLETP